MASVLIVDDEPNILEVLEIVLKEEGMDVARASSGGEALTHLRRKPSDIVISDIQMPDMSGVNLLREAKLFVPDTLFIMITAFASTDTAIAALQHGAFGYLTKPFKMQELREIVRRAFEEKHLSRPDESVETATDPQKSQKLFQALHRNQIVGRSPNMAEVYKMIGTVAAGESTVLITGESGTGKELVARAIHEASPRGNNPFVSINCGAFPETLLESELFGYMKGAFTGANANRKGLFEVAGGGSIFLDEIGEMTPSMQVKLLRVLQERKLRPLGGANEVPVDVRVIAATNRDLQSLIQEGCFRQDLFYRIAVINIQVPPLRERREDIALLAFHFLKNSSEKTGKKVSGISEEALRCLETYSWPGNVRELENTIERAVALETTGEVQLDRLPATLWDTSGTQASAGTDLITIPKGTFDLEKFLGDLERSLICEALKQSSGNQSLAARNLSLTKPSLRHRIQALQIDTSRFRRGP